MSQIALCTTSSSRTTLLRASCQFQVWRNMYTSLSQQRLPDTHGKHAELLALKLVAAAVKLETSLAE